MAHRLFRRWRVSDARWNVGVLAFVLLYAVVINQFLHVRPDHLFLAFILMAFAFLGRAWGRRFLLDWSPFVIFWVLYDMMRGVADSIKGGFVHVEGPYRLEAALMGWLTHGQIPAIWFAGWRDLHAGHWYKSALDLLSANMYTIHFGAPLVFGWILWQTVNDRRTFYRFVYTLTVLNFSGLATFMVYPAAPPWYVHLYGFRQPATLGMVSGAVGGLLAVDQMFKMKLFTSLWDHFSPNLFAAIPSLHGTYPVVIALFATQRFGRRVAWIWIYPALTWFAAVYLNQHYIIDLLIGAAYLAGAYLLTERVLMPRLFDRWLKFGTRAPAGAPVESEGVLTEK